MNDRERFLETVNFSNPDRVPYLEYSLRGATLDRWQMEGMPADVYPTTYFGLDRREFLPLILGLLPPFEEIVLEETERYKVWMDSSGAKRRDFKTVKTPGFVTRQWLEFPVKNREDPLKIKERHNTKSLRRYPEWWEDLTCCWKDRTYPLGIHLQGLFWWVRNLMGLHGTCICFNRDPDLMCEMMSFLVEFQLKAIQRAVEDVVLDYGYIVEDMAYKSGPMISPQMVREFMLPSYR